MRQCASAAAPRIKSWNCRPFRQYRTHLTLGSDGGRIAVGARLEPQLCALQLQRARLRRQRESPLCTLEQSKRKAR